MLVLMLSMPALAATARDATSERLAEAERLIEAWPDRAGGLDEAERIVDDVLAADPDAADAYRVRAMVLRSRAYIRGKEYDPTLMGKAERAVDEAIAKDPKNDRAYVLRSGIYALTDRADRANADLDRAETLAPRNPWIPIYRADLLFSENRDDDAAQGCTKARKLAPDDQWVQASAIDCLVRYQRRAGHAGEVEKLYREQIAMDPSRAWRRGNYAMFLSCQPGRYEDAIIEARKAIELLPYPAAKATLATALYRRWAAEVLAGDAEKADATWTEAREFGAVDVAGLLESWCGGQAQFDVLLALRATGRATLYSPQQGISLAIAAHDRDETGVMGVFRVEVTATGRGDGMIYLNSFENYRDPRCLTVVFLPKAIEAFRAKHGVDPDVYFKGKTITAVGVARRVKINITSNSPLVPDHYFQTHVVVTEPAQVELLDASWTPTDRG